MRSFLLLAIAASLGCATTQPPPQTANPPPPTSDDSPRDPNVAHDQLDKRDIVDGASKARPAVAACFDRYQAPGMASVGFTISNDGTPTNVNVNGQFAGTPTGRCIEDAVAKTARFRHYTGAPQSIIYPFILR